MITEITVLVSWPCQSFSSCNMESSLHVVKFSFNVFNKMPLLSLYEFCTFLVRVNPGYFTSFRVIVNGIITLHIIVGG